MRFSHRLPMIMQIIPYAGMVVNFGWVGVVAGNDLLHMRLRAMFVFTYISLNKFVHLQTLKVLV